MESTKVCSSGLLEPKIMRALEAIGAADVDGADRTAALAELEAHVIEYVAQTGVDPYDTIVAAWDWHRVIKGEELESSSGDPAS